MNKNILFLILIALIVGFGVWIYSLQLPATDDLGTMPIRRSDSPARISGDLESLNVSDIDQEFDSIDRDLNQL